MSRMGLKCYLVLLLGLGALFGSFSGALAENAGNGAGKEAVSVKLETSMGDIVMRLDPAKAPISVANFVKYVEDGFYNGTVFHRVAPGFVIQGGGYDVNMHEKDTRAPIENEAANGLSNDRYTVAMARTSDPQSATAQFYINLVDNKFLNYKDSTRDGAGYAVFGKVISGQDVVDKIGGVAVDGDSVPVKPVVINKAEVVK